MAQTKLLTLGVVNVICGKNNSGKSTLLSKLERGETTATGLECEAIDVATVTTDILNRSGLSSSHPSGARFLTEFVEQVVAKREIWFEDDAGEFASEVQSFCKENYVLQRWELRHDTVVESFRRIFPKLPKTVLLPPKRNLELGKVIALNDQIQPDGAGLLNFLFFGRNQPDSDEARTLHDSIADAFCRITAEYYFQVFPTRDNRLQLRFRTRDGAWVPAGACGLGLQDLLVIIYFAISPDAELILIEEPESHIHPDMQRRLLSFLRDTSKQYVLTTHSNVFLNNAFVDRVFFTTFDGQVHVTDETSRASILDDLGYSVSENLVSDLVILVEGPTDAPVLEELLKQAKLYGRFDIKIWPLGGDIMDQLDLSVFAERYQIIALLDRDDRSARVRRRFEEKCKASGVPVHRLARYALENYFTLTALRQVFGSQISENVQQLDPNRSVEDQIGINVKRNNRKIVRQMTLDDIRDTDLQGFVNRVREILS